MDILITDEQRERYIGFDDRKYIPFGVFILSLILPFFIEAKSYDDSDPHYQKALVSVFYISFHWILARRLFVWIRTRLDEDKFSMKRLYYMLFGLSGIILFVNFIGGGLEILLRPWEIGTTSSDPTLMQGLLISALLCIMLSAIYESVFWFKKYRVSVVEQEQLKRINVQAQLDTLKNQVNPHFLFNSLNTLVSIIPEDPELAIEFVHKMSKTYRNILEFRNEKTIALEKELEALSSYIFLLKMRFQNKIEITIDMDKDLYSKHIVPLSLQMLIENAIKHNIVSQKRPLKIELYEETGNIIVRNNLQIKNQQHYSTKVGLANIKNRYKLISDRAVQIVQDEQFFNVYIPLLNRPL